MSEFLLPPVLPTAAIAAAQVSAVAVARMPAELAGMTAGTILTGVVIGRESGGQTVIRTQYGALILKGAGLPMGGTIKLQLQQTGAQTQVVILSVNGGTPGHREGAVHGAPLPQATAPQQAADALRMLSGHWDALAEALRGSPALRSRVPGAGPELAALVLTLIDALKRGSLADWIGRDNLRALPDALASRLAEDFTHMSRLGQSEPDAWRFVPIPLFHHDTLDQALLFVRRHHRHDGAPDDEAGTRILIEIEHSSLGRIQIDALVHSNRFDVIVRSHDALAEELRAGIAAIHDEARSIAGLVGTIGFLPTREFVAPPIAIDTYGITA